MKSCKFFAVPVLLFLLAAYLVSCSSAKPILSGRREVKSIEKNDHPDYPNGVACYVCHKTEVPARPDHAKFGKNCDKCHVKTTWMAEKYAHDSWPLDEIHRVRCTRCHAPKFQKDFTQYQCYGCHHEAESIKNTHPDISTAKLTRCSECHKGFPAAVQ